MLRRPAASKQKFWKKKITEIFHQLDFRKVPRQAQSSIRDEQPALHYKRRKEFFSPEKIVRAAR
jgi:hypothetical protein